MMSEENHVNEASEDLSQEMRQLEALAAEIDGTQITPPTLEEQAAADEAAHQDALNEQAFAIGDEAYTDAVRGGVNALWTFAAPNWQLEEAELEPMAQLTKVVIDKHFPNAIEKAGPEVMLGMIALSVITSRVAAGIPPRGALPAQGGDSEQG